MELYGRVAQLGEHLLCKQGVAGSIPATSTNHLPANQSLTNWTGACPPQFGSIWVQLKASPLPQPLGVAAHIINLSGNFVIKAVEIGVVAGFLGVDEAVIDRLSTGNKIATRKEACVLLSSE